MWNCINGRSKDVIFRIWASKLFQQNPNVEFFEKNEKVPSLRLTLSDFQEKRSKGDLLIDRNSGKYVQTDQRQN